MASHRFDISTQARRSSDTPTHIQPHEPFGWKYSNTAGGCDGRQYRHDYSPKRMFGELDEPHQLNPSKHPRHFSHEPFNQQETRGFFRREPYEWNERLPRGPNRYQDYGIAGARASGGQYESLRPEVSRSYSDEKIPRQYSNPPSRSDYSDHYNNYDMVSPKYSYRPEAYPTVSVPKSPISHRDMYPAYQYNDECGKTGYRGGNHSAAAAYGYHAGFSKNRQDAECFRQGRDDEETMLRSCSSSNDGSRDRVMRTSSSSSDESRDRRDGYENIPVRDEVGRYAAYHDDRSLVARRQPGARHLSPLVSMSHHENPRNSPSMASTMAVECNFRKQQTGANAELQADQQWPIANGVSPDLRIPNVNVKEESRASSEPRQDTLLLALPEDVIALSKPLCIIRANVEVFRATSRDVDAPAPGRKNPVSVGQVGLRCIHCRHLSDRVKRAVCYPSSLRRFYRTITDMKLDHFTACPGVPQEVKGALDNLKVLSSRSTGTTMRYFVDSAMKLGLVDADGGVRFKSDTTMEIVAESGNTATSSVSSCLVTESKSDEDLPRKVDSLPVVCPDFFSKMSNLLTTSSKLLVDEVDLSRTSGIEVVSKYSESDTESDDPEQPVADEPLESGPDAVLILAPSSECQGDQECQIFHGCVLLSQNEDKFMLSPLRSFLRENVYAFSATEEDIATRTPTNFSITLGRVGLCCKHCHKIPPKDRSNRAVCFPFSIDRLYQSVADLQRFHFTICKEVPADVKEKFEYLKCASSKGSKGLATRQYWVTSAKKLGLVDSTSGIKFWRDPHAISVPAISLDILAQVAVGLTTQCPLVVPDDRSSIAEFLYFVMLQLQPCRFTEADRNKRRMKEVGCIGVECKHCVGQVDSRKFFWSSVNAVESNFISVHTHLMECRFIPTAMKEKLADLKALRKEHTAKLKNGSQKAFFARIWRRLHEYAGIEISPNSSFESS
eukprot:CAMPEP_0172416644 /NCGR_PEP_ID=MMETSP1064-20121228/3162_1 /TAXON_ID=202472 /ORGANISM="Aulacoseira subarctica , Strain CCAP 1002/5" /LENGTH=951 /DNA_ID=CAMNT_0013154477 /DNA_START=109 /DNA_END=2960 /DNA_ORIENTATION=-